MARTQPLRHAPAHRWITVQDAASRLPLGDTRARALLESRGLIRTITDTDPKTGRLYTLRAVWLPALEQVSDDLAADARRAAQLARAPGRQPLKVLGPLD